MAHHKYRKGGVPIATNKISSNVAIMINSGILILLTLLLANFVALVVHVWYFLPHNGIILLQPPLLSSSSSLSLSNTLDDRIQLCNNNVTVTTKSTDGRIFQKRTRCSNNVNINININTEQQTSSSALQLQHALSSAFQTNDKIVRYDIVPTILDQTNDYYGVVHQLPSIPNRRRMIVDNSSSHQNNNNNIPSNAIHNLTYFLESRLRPNEEDRPLYIYNPMVLPLDEKVLNENILSDLNLMDNKNNNNNNDLDAAAAYIGIFRISNFGNCHGPGKGVPETYHNYIGIALLDSNLNIIIQEEDTTTSSGDGRRSEHIDVVIDLNQHLYDIKWHKRDKVVKQYMQDCQLVAVPSSTNKDILPSQKKKKADQLVLICNEYAMKVRLQRITTTSKTLIGGQENNNMDDAIHIKNTYGSTLQLTAIERPHTIIHGGKNLHYFQGGAIDKSSGGSGNISTQTAGKLGYLELWPGGPHEVLNMDFVNYPLPPNAIKSTQDEEPEPSFTTIDKKSNSNGRNDNNNNNIGPLITRDSGSACCVSIQYEGRQLLLGFSHRKTRRGLGKEAQYNYVSRVYAFEATPPFVIVARSGLFCLGFALSDEARQSDNEQVFGAANDAKLEISGEVFNCPRIHFITGIAEKMGDDMKVIISYGINDCYPRMMEVSKSFLVGLLKPTV